MATSIITNRRNGTQCPPVSAAAQVPAVFHDVRTGSIAVPCLNGTPTAPPYDHGLQRRYGLDLATGLGSGTLRAGPPKLGRSAPAPPVITSLTPNPLQPLSDAVTGPRRTGFVSGSVVTAKLSGLLHHSQQRQRAAQPDRHYHHGGTDGRTWTIRSPSEWAQQHHVVGGSPPTRRSPA